MSYAQPSPSAAQLDPLAAESQIMPTDRDITEPARSMSDVRAGLPPIELATALALAVIDTLPQEVRTALESAALTPKACWGAVRNLHGTLEEIDQLEEASVVGKQRAKLPAIDAARTIVEKLRPRVEACRVEGAFLRRPATNSAKPDPAAVASMRWHVDALLGMPRTHAQEAISKAAERLLKGSRDPEDRQMLEAIVGAPRILRERLIGAAPQSAERLRSALDPERARAAAWCDWAGDLAENAIGHAMNWLDAQRHAVGAPTAQQAR